MNSINNQISKKVAYEFFGVYDEFKMLKSKYNFYHKNFPQYFKILYDQSRFIMNPFILIDEYLDQAKQLLVDINILNKNNSIGQFSENHFDIVKWEKFQKIYIEITFLLNILKINLLKKTSSHEIFIKESGYPRNSERTNGNDGFFKGAENLILSVIPCLKTHYKWDGIFSFQSPMYSEPEIWGGMCKIFALFNIYHIFLPDESKFYPINYYTIFHEISHPLILMRNFNDPMNCKEQRSFWFFTFFKFIWQKIKDHDITSEFNEVEFRYIIEEFICDYFASKMAGFYYYYAFLTYFPLIDLINYIRFLIGINVYRHYNKSFNDHFEILKDIVNKKFKSKTQIDRTKISLFIEEISKLIIVFNESFFSNYFQIVEQYQSSFFNNIIKDKDKLLKNLKKL